VVFSQYLVCEMGQFVLGIFQLLCGERRRRAIEALEARAPPPDGVSTLVNSLQNRVKSITLRNF